MISVKIGNIMANPIDRTIILETFSFNTSNDQESALSNIWVSF